MIITFWGVRGSLPTPSPQMLRYGGNTSCVSLDVGGRVLVLDAGTGIRALGEALARGDEEVFLLLSHLHMDHIIGFPFFGPLYESGRVIHPLSYHYDGHLWSPLALFDGMHFPLRPGALPADCRGTEADALPYLRGYGFDVEALAVNHPGGAFGYRITHGPRSLVYIPDNEIDPPEPGVTSFEALVAFCRGTDVLCHDAQYGGEDLPARPGWGHSTMEQACELARSAGVGRLLLFHHDPDRTDDALDALQAEASRRLAPHGIRCDVAREGLRIDLG